MVGVHEIEMADVLGQVVLAEPFMPPQRGPCCGLFALAAVSNALGGSPIPATSRHARGVPTVPVLSLRKKAKDIGVTRIGEIFSADEMVKLATSIGLKAEVVTKASDSVKAWSQAILAALRAGRYVLAPFGVGDKGEPQRTGLHPHWCVLYGATYKRASSEVVTLAAKHWATTFRFDFAELRGSSVKIKDLGGDAWWAKAGSPLDYEKCKPGASGGHSFAGTALSEILAGKLVAVGE